MSRLWIYRNNSQEQGEMISSGRWRDFFRKSAAHGATEWGSTEWIRSPESRKIIRDELQVGDLFLCWQTDQRAAIGLARLDRLEDRDGWSDLVLEAVCEFPAPVRLRELAKQQAPLRKVNFIARHSQGTLARASQSDAEVILKACGVDPKTLEVRAVIDRTNRLGAGFGDAANNKTVEEAGMKVVQQALRAEGWEVENVSDQRGIGYDLLATKDGQEVHIEVKALTGATRSFVLTDGELRASKRDRRWKLAVVTQATSRPSIAWYDRSDLKQLDIRPISHMVRDLRES